MSKVKNNDLILAVRMCELCRPPTIWNRSLWAVSTQTVLRELLEAASIRRDGILSDASVMDLQGTAAIQIGKDPGAGDAKARRLLNGSIQRSSVITPGSLAAANIAIAINEFDTNYLLRWANTADQGISDSQLELCARCVVSHLLNNGHSSKAVLDRIRDVTFSKSPRVSTAGELIRELQSLSLTPTSAYRAVIPVTSAPLSGKTSSPGWMKGAEVANWMKQERRPPFQPGDRINGAVTFEVTARDFVAAAELAAERFVQIRDRAILGTQKQIQPLGHLWLSGHSGSFQIEPIHRGVEIASLARQDCIYVISGNPAIERAIALLAELDHGPASAAVTSGWAALESLCMGPAEDGNRIETAMRAASLVTASFVRAELTTLAYSYAKSNKDAVSADIKRSASNKERTEKILHRLITPPFPTFGRIDDSAAAKRMAQLISKPAETLNRVNSHVSAGLRRLYRLRNLVAHGGRTDSVVIQAGLRAAAPLVGAVFDRIHHANTSEAVSPVELIARAQLRLSLIDAAQPSQLVVMLE